MKWMKYQIHTTTKDADAIGDILCGLGVSGYEITDHVPLAEEEERRMYTDIPADMGVDDGSCVLTFYTELPEQKEKACFSTGSSIRDEQLQAEAPPVLPPEKLLKKIKKQLRNKRKYIPIETPQITYSEVDDTEWKDKWKENFRAFRVADDIIIKPSWEEIPDDAAGTDIILEIDPGSAFGTGTHETTRLCLASLREFIKPDTRILDAGCGSGILALSALLCGAKSAFCLDIDSSAVEATLENARKNQIPEGKLTAVHANILTDARKIEKMLGNPVDIAVANILADVIIPLTKDIGAFIRRGGLFISSGILREKAEEVEKALKENHFCIERKKAEGDWVCFVARKLT